MIKLLIDRLKENKKNQALEMVYNWFGKNVYYAAYYILNNKHLAEEVTQETFVVAYQNIDQIRDINKVEAWLIRIATNKAYDLIKKQKKIVLIDNIHMAIAAEDDPESYYIRQEQKNEIEKALLNLPPEYQVIILLKYYRQLTVKQIAEAINIPEGTAKSRLRKARDLLMELLIRPHEKKKGVN